MLNHFCKLFKKEFMGYFLSYTAYFVFALYIFISMMGNFYFGAYFLTDNTSLYSFFAFQPQILLVIIPAIAMRSWADEKKTGTFEVVLSYPISYKTMVLSKFFACFAISLFMLSLTSVLWVYSAYNLSLDNSVIFWSYIGCVFVIAMFCAISCFVSSTNSSPIVSYLISVFLLWILVNIDYNFIVKPLFYISNVIFVSSQGALNFGTHYNSFISAQLGFDDIIYFVSFVIFALSMNKAIIEDRKDKGWVETFVVGILVFVLLLFINIVSTTILANSKLDLTTDSKYSLSKSTKDIISQVPEKIDIKIYLSKDLAKSSTSLFDHSHFVLNFLEKYKKASHGLIDLDIRNPERYSVVEREAKENGILSFLGNGENELVYFGAVISNSSGESYTIGSFLPDRKEYLERDISRIIYRLSKPDIETKKIGWVNTLGFEYYDQIITSLLLENYEVVKINENEVEIPADIDALVVVNLQSISKFLSYAFDQYVLRGGGVLAFVDNFNQQQKSHTFSKYTPSLLEKWGVQYGNELVVTDNLLSSKRVVNVGLDKKVVDDVLSINLTKDYINQNNLITKGLDDISFHSPALISYTKKDNIKITSLLKTSKQSSDVKVNFAKMDDPKLTFDNQNIEYGEHDLAILIEGEVLSSFGDNILSNTKYEGEMLPFLPISLYPSKFILVSDVDVLKGDDWSYYGDNITPYSLIVYNKNLDFILRSIDFVAGNDILLGLGNETIIQNKKTVAERIKDKIRLSYADEQAQIYVSMSTRENEIRELLTSMNNMFSMDKARNVEILNKEYDELKERNKHIDYIISSQANDEIYWIVVWMSFILPLFSSLLMFLIVLLYTRYKKKKILEMLNEI